MMQKQISCSQGHIAKAGNFEAIADRQGVLVPVFLHEGAISSQQDKARNLKKPYLGGAYLGEVTIFTVLWNINQKIPFMAYDWILFWSNLSGTKVGRSLGSASPFAVLRMILRSSLA